MATRRNYSWLNIATNLVDPILAREHCSRIDSTAADSMLSHVWWLKHASTLTQSWVHVLTQLRRLLVWLNIATILVDPILAREQCSRIDSTAADSMLTHVWWLRSVSALSQSWVNLLTQLRRLFYWLNFESTLVDPILAREQCSKIDSVVWLKIESTVPPRCRTGFTYFLWQTVNHRAASRYSCQINLTRTGFTNFYYRQ